MKNKLFILALLSASSLTFAQVGINTGSPQATLDVTGMPATKKHVGWYYCSKVNWRSIES
jgi:hypothetical protein